MNFLCLFVCVFPDVSRSLIVEARKLNVNRNTGETILHKAARLGYHVSITCTTLALFELCQVAFRVLKCIRQIFFCSIKSPQCTDMYSKEKFLIAIFLTRVLMYQKRQISLPVGSKPRDLKHDTANDCDVISGFRLREKQIFQSFCYCELIN